ncbi:hypothetical protein B7463_g6171, partial [Scytalidium lignicola]
MAGTEEVGSLSSSDPMVGVEKGMEKKKEKPRGRLRKYVRKVKRLFNGEDRSKPSPKALAAPAPSTIASPLLSLAAPSPNVLPSIETAESRSPQDQDAPTVEVAKSSMPTLDTAIEATAAAAAPEPVSEGPQQISSDPVEEISNQFSPVPIVEKPKQVSPPIPVTESSERISPELADASERISPEPILPRPIKFSPEPDSEREGSPFTSVGRISRLGEPWDLSIEPHEWGYSFKRPPTLSRVERPIRARIHRMCHRCNIGFGATKICASCGHTRCKLCPRHPNRRIEENGQQGMSTEAVGSSATLHSQTDTAVSPGGVEMPTMEEPTVEEESTTTETATTAITPTVAATTVATRIVEAGTSAAVGGMVGGVDIDLDDFESLRQKYIMSRPVRTGGQPLVKKKPMQRCEHFRCDDCPRDPPKRRKYPNGYPGDTPRLITRNCHYCSHNFPPIPRLPSSGDKQLSNVGLDGEPIECMNCGHIQCSECPVELPWKTQFPAQPDMARSPRSRIAQFGPTAGGELSTT